MIEMYDDPYDLMILDLKLENGPVKQEDISNAVIGSLLSTNVEMEDIMVLMASLDKTSDMLDIEMDHFKHHFQLIMRAYREVKNHPIER